MATNTKQNLPSAKQTKQATQQNAPTLVIGLGGIGSKIISKVAHLVGEDASQRRIEFVAFDTDVNELRQVRDKNPVVRIVQTSTRMTVGQYLQHDATARDDWFPVNETLNRKVITEGAGQVRAISRLAFEATVRQGGMEELHDAIDSLYRLETDAMQQSPRIIIVSSLCGGTGSGLILPMALYVNNYLKTRFTLGSSLTRGFFLLPELMYGTVTGQAERNNLKCNAYATLRELDAFMMKGEGQLPARYQDIVKFEFPKSTGHGTEEYDVMPYDFCFLFDAQNTESANLITFQQYLDQAANCIYAQSIGPMNRRSNSSEDNTIRDIVRTQGRNRYAGAGSSLLEYPKEGIVRYLALTWIEQTVNQNWLYLDKQVIALKAAENRRRESGNSAQTRTTAQAYVYAADDAYTKKSNDFVTALVRSCMAFDETGFEPLGNNWDRYLAGLTGHIAEVADASRIPALDNPLQQVRSRVSELVDSNDGNAYRDAYYQVKQYMARNREIAPLLGKDEAFSLFHSDPSDEDTGQNNRVTQDIKRGDSFRVETYLKDQAGDFLPPYSIRYFLYKTQALFEARTKSLVNEIQRLEDDLTSIDQEMTDVEGTDVIESTPEEKAAKKVGVVSTITKRPAEFQEQWRNSMSSYLDKVEDYRRAVVLKEVLTEGLQYIKNMGSALEDLFKSLTNNIKNVPRERADIERRYEYHRGETTRYVCASSNCLARFEKAAPFLGNAFTLDPELSAAIYARIRVYISIMDRGVNESFFDDVFTNVILPYYEKLILSGNEALLDIDILQAMRQEIEFTDPNGSSIECQDQGMVKIIEEAKHLATPFISQKIGDQPIDKPACTYNPELADPADPVRMRFVEENLAQFGGEPDDEISKNRIFFYRAIYGLQAKELQKFAAPVESSLAPHPAGDYYTAYFELIDKLGPITANNRELTPHLDKHWHLISHLPDLDEVNQRRREKAIHLAFFTGLVMKFIAPDPVREDLNKKEAYAYKLSLDNANGTQNLVVFNGSDCDQLYEIIEALTINTSAVNDILANTANVLKRAALAKKPKSFEDSLLFQRIQELDLGMLNPLAIDKPGIFDLTMLVKTSAMSGNYIGDMVPEITSDIWEYIAAHAAETTPDSHIEGVLKDFFDTQFKAYAKHRSIYREALSSDLFAVEADMREHLKVSINQAGFNNLAEYVRDTFRTLKSGQTAEPSHAA